MLEMMLEENEELKKEWDSSFKLKNDPRIIKIGKFLRKTSLDELPQFFLCLTGLYECGRCPTHFTEGRNEERRSWISDQ